MRVTDWQVRVAEVVMDAPFGHAAARHDRTASVLVEVRCGDVVGWGEGAPRRYVTGETVRGAAALLAAVEPALLGDLVGAGPFEEQVARLAAVAGSPLARLLGGGAPAASAAAAVELALLDLVCRRHGRPLDAVLGLLDLAPGVLRDVPAPVVPSFVVDLSQDPVAALGRLPEPTRGRLQHVKVKVDADLDAAVRHARAARAACPAATVSVDANGVLDPDAAVAAAPSLREAGVAWIEEPFGPRAWDSLRRLAGTGLGVMLDESFRDAADLELAARLGAAGHVNVRISKCGGLIPAARLVDRARALGVRHQLGVQVGEVGPLWAAGRALACRLADPCAVEAGRQDEWFAEPLTEPAFAVDRSLPAAPPLAGPGNGVVPSTRLRRRWTPVPVPARVPRAAS